MTDSAVITGADSKYLPGVLALLNSLRTHSPQEPVIVLAMGWRKSDHRVIARYSDRFPEQNIEVCEPDFDFARFPTPGPARTKHSASYSQAVYLRLAISEVLPSLGRALWMDADAIAMTDIAPLLHQDLGDKPLAALTDRGNATIGGRASRFPGTYLDSEALADVPYLNAGVMVMNLDLWRQRDITEKCLEFYERSSGKLLYPIQDALNSVILGDYAQIDPRWNVSNATEYLALRGLPPDLEYKLEDSPWVLHFYGSPKPWDRGYPEGRNLERFKDVYPEGLLGTPGLPDGSLAP